MAVAFGKGVDGLVRDAGEEAGFDRFFNRVLFRGAGEFADIGAEFEETDDCHVIVKWCGFREVTDLRFRLVGIFGDGNTADFGVAAGGWEEAGDHSHRGGFSGAVGSEEAENFTFFDREGEVIDGELRSEMFADIDDFDHGDN